MTKILGYENKEIASHLLSTTIVVVIEDAVSVFMNLAIFEIQPAGYVKMFADRIIDTGLYAYQKRPDGSTQNVE